MSVEPDPVRGRRPRAWATAVVVALLAVLAPAAAHAAGTTLTNCGVTVRVDRPPTRAVSLNQGATEVMLTLGLQKSMIGTAYLDDAVLPSLRKAYASVPVLAKEYPPAEKFLSVEPDFAFASYTSAFSKEGVGSRGSLAKLGIQTYVEPRGCAGVKATRRMTFRDVFGEIRQIGAIFGVGDRAERVIDAQKAALKRAVGSRPPGKGLKLLWWDSETKSPVVGACCGGPSLIMRTVGATNVFADVKGNWKSVSWEQALARDPDVIVLADASWDRASAKRRFLAKDPATRNLPAVKRGHFVTIPFSDSTPGVRNVEGVRRLAVGLRKLANR